MLMIETTTKNETMNTISDIKSYFSEEGTKSISNDAAGYQFVKRAEGEMFQYSNGKYKSYYTFDGFCKAVLWRIKRG